MTGFTFSARSYASRLHCAEGAIEASLRAEVQRLGAGRAFVVSSPSIASRTATVSRVEQALGDARAGTFAGIENELYFDPKTSMLFGDAKSAVSEITAELAQI